VRESGYFLTLLVTAAVTYLLTPLVRKTAIRIKAVPPIRDRDVHAEPIPRMGGLAMYFGVAAGLLVATQIGSFREILRGTGLVNGLLLAGGLIVAIGVIDDRWGLSAIGKLAGQIAAAAVLVLSGVQLSTFPLPKDGVFELTHNEGVVVTILLVVATINAVNFIDGLDGLAAGIVCIAAISFFLYYYSLTKVAAPHYALPAEAVPALASVVLAGACIGFLPHNFFPARIIMGDTGSMLLGLLLAYIPISAISTLDFTSLASRANRYAEILPLLLPAAVMVIPYTDMLRAVIRRTRAGLSPFAADRKHLHHRMLDIGHSHRSSVLILYAWAALFAGTVVGLSIVTAPLIVLVGTTLVAVLVLVLLSIPRLRWWESRGAAHHASRGRRRSAGPAARSARAPLIPAGLQASAEPGPVAYPAPVDGRTAAHAGDQRLTMPPAGSGPAARYAPGLEPRPRGAHAAPEPTAPDLLNPESAAPEHAAPQHAAPDAPPAAGAPVDATVPLPVTRASGSIVP
jgi:UDP-GlcNAc:undecaprenyl-phosphate GlcNAc-1-phosphate transferase